MEDTYRDALEAGSSGYSQEFRCRTREGKIRWLCEDVSAEPVPATEGKERWHLVGICTDITERKQAQLAMSTEIAARKRTEAERLQLLAHEQQARAEAERARQRLAFLADASTLLSTSLDYETTLKRVAPWWFLTSPTGASSIWLRRKGRSAG